MEFHKVPTWVTPFCSAEGIVVSIEIDWINIWLCTVRLEVSESTKYVSKYSYIHLI